MSKALTINDVKYAKLRDKEYLMADGRQGLYLRILPTGRKSWIYKYRLEGKSRKHTLGQYPDLGLADAREAHSTARKLVRSGQDPAAPLEQKSVELKTVASLIEDYKVYSKENKAEKTSHLEAWGLDKYVLPSIGSLYVKNVKRRDAIELIEGVGKGGMAAQILKYSRAMFTFALNRDLVEYNPFSAIASAVPAVKPHSRSRTLSDTEIRHLWQQLISITDPRSLETRRALLLILVTGQRPEEVTSMHDREMRIGVSKPRCILCRRCGWWVIPWERIKTRSKRKQDHHVFLSPLAMKIIRETSGYVFKGPKDNNKPLLRQALSHYVVDHEHFGLPHWTPHDLRRTCGTWLARLGCSDEVIDAILNHSKKGTISIYNQYKYASEKQHWLTVWEKHLQTIIDQSHIQYE